VAGGQGAGADLLGLTQEEIELDLRVAGDAGIGGAPLLVVDQEGIDDAPVELLLDIEHVVGNVEPRSHPAGVFDGVEGAAAVMPVAVGGALGPELEGDADDIETVLLEQRSRDRTVDAAGHSHSDSAHMRTRLVAGA